MRDVKKVVVTLIYHGYDINLMSMDFYEKGEWLVNTNQEWKIRVAT